MAIKKKLATIKKKRGNPNWVRGKSGNPKGRARGIKDKRVLASEKLLNQIGEVSDVVIEKAKEGDIQAAGLIFGRVLPALSPQTEIVQFDLDTSAPLAKQAEQVLTAVATGKVSVDVARKIIETVGALSAIRQSEELEQRIIELENSL